MEGPAEKAQGVRYPWYWMAALPVVFAAVHTACYAAGVRFDRDTLIEVMHFLDPELLRTRLIESLWYLHIQPPLMNLLVGLVLKMTPNAAWLFQMIYLACGLTLYLCVFLLQVRLGVRRAAAAALATVFMASPSFILWEHYLLYEMPVAALLALAAVLLLDTLETGRRAPIAGFFLCLFLVCGMRSMFHLGYFVLMFGALMAFCKGRRKRVLVLGAVPLLILFGFYFKNWVLFGDFSVCTFVDKNLWIMTAGNLRWEDKVRLVEEGKLSELSLVNRWAHLEAYPEEYQQVPERFAGIPALTDTHKSTGAVNYNHYGNIAICKIYGKDARYVLTHYPKVFFISTALSWYRYFVSSSALPVSPQNQEKILPVIRLYDNWLYGKFPFDLAPYSRLISRGGYPPYVFLLLGLPFVLFYGLFRAVWPGPARLNRAQRLAVLFLCFNIFAVAALGCTFDFLETARYRFMTDGLSVVLLGLLFETAVLRRCDARRAATQKARSATAHGTGSGNPISESS